ncbi:ECF RNA polymerase sigma factor SigK [Prauserella cavernicola]|uniref:ECF RNA polymerase sigma factor SigK n=1 Tax=Prauserella cavernicola TaxID=2800127 RepID=A0A934QQA2_9PSEU|nr:ECF RNA polymerase sigma factor SigK [Prauserella cavernicola]MBK1783754.1 ECF RNA polymerase sigma factor SigK [Prauserella cavernicola]
METPESLIEQVAKGDKDAFADLYDQLAGAVTGMAARVLRNQAHAEEVMQEAFLEVWRKAGTYSPDRGSVRTWALTIAHRRAVDRVRSANSATEREVRDGLANPHRDFDEVSDAVLAGFERAEVRTALQSLTAPQRQAIVLAYFEGHTYAEVAVLLELPVGTVKSRMREGLFRLRTSLEVSGDDE